ncbi:MAG: L-threonylcarbamoyladenylate synthase [Chloroflexi bacterium]|nr:L-threonylcarbamoyladenylate synthase [Chloroflexota bacterium]
MDAPDTLDNLIERGAGVLTGGGLLGLPTDTQYALSALASDGAAVMRCYACKQRPDDDAMPIFLPSLDWLDRVATDIPAVARGVAEEVWPGAVTLVLQRNPEWRSLAAPGKTVALRIPDHPLALGLLAAIDAPLTGSSANRHGQPPALRADDVRTSLGEDVTVLPEAGVLPQGTASTILAWSDAEPRILRPGAMSNEHVEALLQRHGAAGG